MYSNSATLDDVEFLTGSPNRLDVFDAIRIAPRTRRELRERLDVSRVTLSRILRDLEKRNWIARADGTYEPTSEGAILASEVARLFANLDAVDGLGTRCGGSPSSSSTSNSPACATRRWGKR